MAVQLCQAVVHVLRRRGGGPGDEGRQLRVARVRGTSAVQPAVHARRQHLRRRHQRHRPRDGILPQRRQQERRLRLHHRRLRLPLHDGPLPQRPVPVRRPLRQVDVGRGGDAGGQRRVQRVGADVRLLQELAHPVRLRRGELAVIARLHLLLRRGQRQGRLPATWWRTTGSWWW